MNKELFWVRCRNMAEVHEMIDELDDILMIKGIRSTICKSGIPRVMTEHVEVRFSYSDGFYETGKHMGLHPKYVLDMVGLNVEDFINRYFPGSKKMPHGLAETVLLAEKEATYEHKEGDLSLVYNDLMRNKGEAVLVTQRGSVPVKITETRCEPLAPLSFEGCVAAYINNDIKVTKDVFDRVYGGVGLLEIEKVVFNNPATIVLWKDGTKTVVKCQAGDTYSKETGLAMCIAKKCLGNEGNFNNVFRKWIPDYEEEKTPKKPIRPVVQIIAKSSIEKRIERLLNDFFDLEKEDKSNG